jgi:LysR family transcriptional activator of mexEF-oprN operon
MAPAQVADAMNRYELPRTESNPLMGLNTFGQMHALRSPLSHPAPFVAATSEASIRLAVSSDVEFALLPMLLRRLRVEAPGIALTVLRADPGQMPALLASGDVTLSIGPSHQAGNSRHQASLRSARPAVLRADTMPDQVCLSELCRRPHARVAFAASIDNDIDLALRELGLQRKVLLSVSQFNVLPALLAQTDMLALVPDYVAQAMVAQGGLRSDPLPMSAGGFDLMMAWDEHAGNDPAGRWLRSRCRMFLEEQSL